MQNSILRAYLRIAPQRFHYLKFILEGYDNMAVLSSYDSSKGIVVIRFPADLAQEVYSLLGAIAGELSDI